MSGDNEGPDNSENQRLVDTDAEKRASPQNTENQEPEFDSVYLETDIDYWAKMPFWTAIEAACVSLNFDPDFLMEASLEDLQRDRSNFNAIEQRVRLTGRAVDIGKISKTASPKEWIIWLHEIDEPITEKLEHALSKLAKIRHAGVKHIATNDEARLLEMHQKLIQALEGNQTNRTVHTKRVHSMEKIIACLVVRILAI